MRKGKKKITWTSNGITVEVKNFVTFLFMVFISYTTKGEDKSIITIEEIPHD